MFFSKRKLIAFLFLFCVVLVLFFLSTQSSTYIFRSAILDAVKIPLLLANTISHEARALVFFHRSYWQNLRLRQENEKLKENLLNQQGLIAENDRLKKILDLKRGFSYATKTASVIGKNFSFFKPYIILDKGKVNGIKKYAPVLTHLGLVGKIVELGYYSSKVILINDPDLSVPALNSRTREHGLVSGTLDGHCKLRFLDIDSDVQKGDVIVTSGLNMTFPEGILIGKVKWVGIEPSGLSKFAILEPAVRLSSVEEVLVVSS